MFGSELYFLIKTLINIERTVDLCVSDDKVLPIDSLVPRPHPFLLRAGGAWVRD